MCSDVGVVKKIELENVSKELADFVKSLEKEVKGDNVDVHAKDVHNIAKKLEKLIQAG